MDTKILRGLFSSIRWVAHHACLPHLRSILPSLVASLGETLHLKLSSAGKDEQTTAFLEVAPGLRCRTLTLDEIPGVLQFSTQTNLPTETRLLLLWDRPDTLQLVSGLVGASLGRMTAVPPVWTGDGEFDRIVRTLGAPQAWVREVLDAETRARILALDRLAGPAVKRYRMRLETYLADADPGSGRSNLVIGCFRDLSDDPPGLGQFLEIATAIFRCLRGTQGIRFTTLTSEEVAEAGRCPVCGEGLAGVLCRCDQCRTLHHEDCFQYNRGCATYACSSR